MIRSARSCCKPSRRSPRRPRHRRKRRRPRHKTSRPHQRRGRARRRRQQRRPPPPPNPPARAELLQTLQAIAKTAAPAEAAPAPAQDESAPPAAPPAARPAAPPTQAAPPAAPPNPLSAGGLIAQLASASSAWFASLSDELVQTVGTFSHFDSFARWAQRVAAHPQDRALVLGGAWRLLLAAICGLAAEWIARRALDIPFGRQAWRRRQAKGTLAPTPDAEPAAVEPPPAHLLQRLPLALARMVLSLLPVAAFVGVGNLLIVVLSRDATTEAVLATAINSYAVWRGITCLTRSIVSPDNPQLRLFAIGDDVAHYIDIWVARLAGVAVFGLALVDIAGLVGLYPAAYRTLNKLVLLIEHVMLVIVVLQSRRRVASWIQAPPGATGGLALIRNRLAAVWHAIAIFLIASSWIVSAVEIQDGYARLLRVVVFTALTLLAARLASIAALGALDRMIQAQPRLPNGTPHPTRFYLALHRGVRLVIGTFTFLVLLEIWGVPAFTWFGTGEIGRRLLSAALTVGFAALAAMAIWEWVNAAIDRYLQRLSGDSDYTRLARMRTLLPIMRTALLVVILVVVGLTALSELGVNIAPLLAGAGIVGIAVGFGSQKLVQDVITGIFLLVENAFQVGDWVTVAGLSGSVEHLSIRSIRLRAIDGSVHIVPFSAVNSVTNASREIANALISVTVAFSEDTDLVGETLRQIAAEMRREPKFQQAILGDLNLWGVDKVDGTGVTIAAEIRCTAHSRWTVQREFNRRMKKRFQELDIKLV